jgi:riboflavin synthase
MQAGRQVIQPSGRTHTNVPMFTGIIEEIGHVNSLTPQSAGARLSVRAETVVTDLPIGGSIAVNGVCLTAVEVTPEHFAADISPETLQRTNLGALRRGSRVNLERPLSPSGRLSPPAPHRADSSVRPYRP